MSIFAVLVLMIFAHIVDDYYLQGILAKLKQKSWWEENAPKDTDALDECDRIKMKPMYRYDYIIGLLVHSISWAIMIALPIFFVSGWNPHWAVYLMIVVNAVIHCIIDDLKANKRRINLIEDQSIHAGQILLTWVIWSQLLIIL